MRAIFGVVFRKPTLPTVETLCGVVGLKLVPTSFTDFHRHDLITCAMSLSSSSRSTNSFRMAIAGSILDVHNSLTHSTTAGLTSSSPPNIPRIAWQVAHVLGASHTCSRRSYRDPGKDFRSYRIVRRDENLRWVLRVDVERDHTFASSFSVSTSNTRPLLAAYVIRCLAASFA